MIIQVSFEKWDQKLGSWDRDFNFNQSGQNSTLLISTSFQTKGFLWEIFLWPKKKNRTLTPHDNMFYSKKTTINDPQWTTLPWKKGEKLGKSRCFLCSFWLPFPCDLPSTASFPHTPSRWKSPLASSFRVNTEGKHYETPPWKRRAPNFLQKANSLQQSCTSQLCCGPEPELTPRQMRHRNEKRTVTAQALSTLLGSLAKDLLVSQWILFIFFYNS